MSAITIGGDLIHYEKLGRGRPVILIHGWIGSWRYWIPLMQKLHLKYSVYTLDLIGFGDSAKNDVNYSITAQVKMLEQFMDQLGIPKAAMIGHGLGSLVLIKFALKQPEKVARMLLTSMPLFDPGDLDERVPAGTRRLLTPRNDRFSLAPRIEDVVGSDKTVANSTPDGKVLDEKTLTNNPLDGKVLDEKTLTSNPLDGKVMDEKTLANITGALLSPDHELPTIGRPVAIDRDALRRAAEERTKATQRPNLLQESFKDKTLMGLLEKCFKKTEPEFEKLKVDVEKSDNKVLQKTSEGYEAGDMLDDLRRVTSPIVAVHGMSDPVMPVPSEEIWNYLTLEKEDVFVPIPLPDVRHFPMLENDAYTRLASDFLEAADISKLEIRERWRRRSR